MKIPHFHSGLLALVCLAGGYALGRWQKGEPAAAAVAAGPSTPTVAGRPRLLSARDEKTKGPEKSDAAPAGRDAEANEEPITADEFARRMGVLSQLEKDGQQFKALDEIVQRALKENPDAVIDWCSASQYAPRMLKDLFTRWANNDPSACAAWLNTHPSSEHRDSMIAGMLHGASQGEKSIEGAWQWVRTIQDTAVQADAAIVSGADAWWSDRTGAEAEVAGLGLPAEMVAAIHSGWAEQAKARVQRDAQNLVSIYQSARSSGVTTLSKAASAREVVTMLSQGVTIDDPSSPFYGKRFSMPLIPEARLPHSLRHVKWSDDGELDYVQNPKE